MYQIINRKIKENMKRLFILLVLATAATGMKAANSQKANARIALASGSGDISVSGLASGAISSVPAYAVGAILGLTIAGVALSDNPLSFGKTHLYMHGFGIGSAVLVNGSIAYIQRHRIENNYIEKTTNREQWESKLAAKLIVAQQKNPHVNANLLKSRIARDAEEMSGKSGYLFYKSFFWGGTIAASALAIGVFLCSGAGYGLSVLRSRVA